MVNTETPRGSLTESDREYLRMDASERREQHSRPNQSQRWSKIEERTRASLQDLGTLYEHLPANRRENVFRPVSKASHPATLDVLLMRGFGFLLRGTLEQSNHDLDDEEYYSMIFERTIQHVLGDHPHEEATIDVDVTIDDWAPWDETHEHADLADLSFESLHMFYLTNRISEEEFKEAICEQEKTA